jgi:hypothetical protein
MWPLEERKEEGNKKKNTEEIRSRACVKLTNAFHELDGQRERPNRRRTSFARPHGAGRHAHWRFRER